MMRKILVVGAGKSTSYLIDYFLEKAADENLHLTIGDINPDAISSHIKNHENCTVIQLDIFNDDDRKSTIKESDIVVSMLPARMHMKVAKDCISFDRLTIQLISNEYIGLFKLRFCYVIEFFVFIQVLIPQCK